MKFFEFLKQVKKRRFLVPALMFVFVVIFGGTIFGLAKTGKLSSLADVITQSTCYGSACSSARYLNIQVLHKTGNTGSADDFVRLGAGKSIRIKYGNYTYVGTTDANSIVKFSGIVPGEYTVEVVGCGFSTQSNGATLLAVTQVNLNGSQNAFIRTNCGSTAQGQSKTWVKVYGRNGSTYEELGGARIAVYTISNQAVGAWTTNKSGFGPAPNGQNYSQMLTLGPGSYYFNFTAGYYQEIKNYRVDISGNNSDEYLTVAMERNYNPITSFTLRGNIVDDANNQTIVGARINLYDQSTNQLISGYSVPATISETDYHFDNLASKNYRVTVSASGYNDLEGTILASEISQSVITRDYRLIKKIVKPTVSVSGRVITTDGKPAANKIVYLYKKPVVGNMVAVSNATTKSDGSFSIEIDNSLWTGLLSGAQLVVNYAQPLYYYPSSTEYFDLKQGDAKTGITIIINTEPTGFRGSLQKAENSDPLSGADVVIYQGDNKIRAKTDNSGKYSVSGLLPNTKYRLFARYPDRMTQSIEATTVDGDMIVVDFKLQTNPSFINGATVQGHLYYSGEQQPLQGFYVYLYRKVNGKLIFYDKQPTDSNGFYQIQIKNDLFVTEGRADLIGQRVDFVIKTGIIWPLSQARAEFFINWQEGMSYWQDLYLTRQADTTGYHDVKVTVVKEIRKFNDGSVISSKAGSGVRVWATTPIAPENNDRPTNISLQSEVRITTSAGVAMIYSLPKSGMRIWVDQTDGYEIDQQKSKLLVGSSDSEAKIYLYKLDTPSLSDIDAATGRYYYGQNVGPWTDDRKIFNRPGNTNDGTTDDNPIKKVGCCLTSIAMAMNYYLPNQNITPGTVGQYFSSHNYNANLSFVSQWQQAVRDLSGGKLTIEISDSNFPNWSQLKSNYIDKGVPVIAHSSGWAGHVSSFGHCVFIYGLGDGAVKYLDPYPTRGSKRVIQPPPNSIDGLIIIRPVQGIGVIYDKVSAGEPMNLLTALLPTAKAANESTIKKGQAYTAKIKLNNVSDFMVAGVYLEKLLGTTTTRYSMSLSNGKYSASIPGYDNQQSFKYRIVMLDKLGVVHPGSYVDVTVSNQSVPVHQRATNTIQRTINNTTRAISTAPVSIKVRSTAQQAVATTRQNVSSIWSRLRGR